MKIILPCCGRASRYPNQPPKWLLPAYDGRPMIQWAVSELNLSQGELIVTILREHEERYQVTAGLKKLFGPTIQVVVLDAPTASQVETVVRTLEQAGVAGPFLIKDSDNMFALPQITQDYNYVCVDSLNNYDEINPRNKSYVSADHTRLINNIREKNVISDTFSVGGYYFTDSRKFIETYGILSKQPRSAGRAELYVSDVIGYLISQGEPFYAEPIKHYHDWGTIHEWRKYLQGNACIFVALDGFAFERGHENFKPTFANVPAKSGAVEALRKLVDQGNSIIYLSVRPENQAAMTQARIEAAGLPSGQVIYGCPNSRWKFVSAPHPVLPLAGFSGMEISPDDPSLYEKISSL